jgi:hypothetical protein
MRTITVSVSDHPEASFTIAEPGMRSESFRGASSQLAPQG